MFLWRPEAGNWYKRHGTVSRLGSGGATAGRGVGIRAKVAAQFGWPEAKSKSHPLVEAGKGTIMTEHAISVEEEYRRSTPRSAEAFQRAAPLTAGAAKGAYFFPPYPLTMARAEGCTLEDIDGHRYLDFANHHTTQILGHNHPKIMQAVQAQLQRGIALGAPTGIEAEIAAEMCRRVASLDRIRFVNSGTEATLHAVRLARGFSRKSRIAKFEGGYHGSHDAVEVSVSPPLDQAGPIHAPHSVPNAGGISPHAAEEVLILPYNDQAAVTKLVEDHAQDLACVIFDPKAGLLPVRPEFARAVREITHKNGVLLIFDEIVGFRVGSGGLQAEFGIDPDLTCFGKIVGGGFPVGAFGGRADLMDLLDIRRGPTGFFQSGSFSAHPVTMAAGLATLRELTPAAFTHLNRLADRLSTELNDLFARRGIPARALNTGSVFSIYFIEGKLENYRDLARADRDSSRRVFLALLQEGYFLNHTLSMCALSLPMEDRHVTGLVGAVEKAIDKTQSA